MARPKAIIPVGEGAHNRALIYGAPGVGKSSFLGSCPGRLLVLASSVDETAPIKRVKPDAMVWHLKDHQEAIEAAEYMQHEGHEEFDHVAVDNATLHMQNNMINIMKDLHALKPHRSLYVPDQAEYLQNQNQFYYFLQELMRAPVHIWITAHVMRVQEDPTTEEDIILPALPGTQGLYSQKICGEMNQIFYMGVRRRKEGNERYIITDQSGKIYAKDRYQGLPRRVTNPTVPGVMKACGLATVPTTPRKPAARRRTATKTTPSK